MDEQDAKDEIEAQSVVGLGGILIIIGWNSFITQERMCIPNYLSALDENTFE